MSLKVLIYVIWAMALLTIILAQMDDRWFTKRFSRANNELPAEIKFTKIQLSNDYRHEDYKWRAECTTCGSVWRSETSLLDVDSEVAKHREKHDELTTPKPVGKEAVRPMPKQKESKTA